MEILEKQDPEKKRLMDEAKKHKDNLKSEVRLVSEQTEKVITNALIIGGALTLTYLLISGLSGSKSKKKKAKTVKLVAQPQSEANEANEESESGDSILSQIGNKIANEATVFLLNIAKEKLNEYLQSRKSEAEPNR
jgi:Icc-related predicted phosphoesterase